MKQLIVIIIVASCLMSVCQCFIYNPRCLNDNQCRGGEFCDLDENKNFGKCQKLSKAGERCVYDFNCASNYCIRYRCAVYVRPKQGRSWSNPTSKLRLFNLNK